MLCTLGTTRPFPCPLPNPVAPSLFIHAVWPLAANNRRTRCPCSRPLTRSHCSHRSHSHSHTHTLTLTRSHTHTHSHRRLFLNAGRTAGSRLVLGEGQGGDLLEAAQAAQAQATAGSCGTLRQGRARPGRGGPQPCGPPGARLTTHSGPRPGDRGLVQAPGAARWAH